MAKLAAAKAEPGAGVRVTRLDIPDPAAVERAAGKAEAATGRIDALVRSTGVAGEERPNAGGLKFWLDNAADLTAPRKTIP